MPRPSLGTGDPKQLRAAETILKKLRQVRAGGPTSPAGAPDSETSICDSAITKLYKGSNLAAQQSELQQDLDKRQQDFPSPRGSNVKL